MPNLPYFLHPVPFKLEKGFHIIKNDFYIRNSKLADIGYPDTEPDIIIRKDFISAFYFDIRHLSVHLNGLMSTCIK